ncbi:MAG: aminotransferase class IV [Candidatus Latescibacterota bacterium]
MVYLNGRMISDAVAAISIEDRGFRYGDGLFETIRVYRGKAFLLERHLRRLEESASALEISLGTLLRGCSNPSSQCPVSLRSAWAMELSEAVERVIAINEISEGAIRIFLTRGTGGGFDISEDLEANLIVTARSHTPVSAEQLAQGVRTIISKHRRNSYSPISRVKSLSFLESVLVRMEARKAGVDEALMRDTEGHLVETSVGNLFFVRGGALYTPPTSCPILPGITRETVIALASERLIPCFEQAMLPEEVAAIDEAFLTSSLTEVMPIVEIDGQRVGTGKPGAVTRGLMKAYQASVRAVCTQSTPTHKR